MAELRERTSVEHREQTSTEHREQTSTEHREQTSVEHREQASMLPARDGVAIAVHDLGGRGRPAVLAHATGFHGLVFAPLAAALGDELACYAPDLRGHGRSGSPSDGDFSWDAMAADVLAAAEHASARAAGASDGSPGGPAPIGVGHSLGATLLLLAEAQRPGTFSWLYCYEPPLFRADQRRLLGVANPHAEGARRRRASFASRAAALERYAARPPLAWFDPAVLARYVDGGFADAADGSVVLRCAPETEARVFEAGYASDALELIGDVGCPVTLAVGARSDDLGRGSAEEALGRLGNARLVELAGCTHFGPLEDPAAVAASILDALHAVE